MTLPTTSPLNGNDDDSDMFGPPRSVGYHHHQRSRVPMISPKLRQREERKRILQLCAHKLERIKDSEANLRRSVCINNTYSRLTDEVRREKQSRYLANLPKSETKPETAHDNMYSPYQHNYNNQMELRNDNYHKSNHQNSYHHLNNHQHHHHHHSQNNNSNKSAINHPPTSIHNSTDASNLHTTHSNDGQQHHHHHHSYSSPASLTSPSSSSAVSYGSSSQTTYTSSSSASSTTTTSSSVLSHCTSSLSSSSSVDNDLEILDRELNAINASMPLIDPEITQGAEQLEKAVSSRKRSRTEEENDRLVREALSQFYLPTQRLISAIDDYPPDLKRTKLSHNITSHHHHHHHSLHHLHHHHHCGSSLNGSSAITDLDIDLSLDINHQNQKEFEVIMDALRLGTSSPTPSAQDSCGQAAMMSESGVFHNLVVTSLET